MLRITRVQGTQCGGRSSNWHNRFRPCAEELETRLAPATIVVNSVADTDNRDNDLTLLEALMLANGTLGVNVLTQAEKNQVTGVPAQQNQRDTINFNMPGTGLQTITLAASLPTITGIVTIDGFTQPGATSNSSPLTQGINATYKIVIDGSKLTGEDPGVGLTVQGPGGSIIRGLVIENCYGTEIAISSSGVCAHGSSDR